MTRPHTTHHESCGCCEAERDALKAQVERLREIVVDREWDGYDESDEAASNCVECGRYCSDGHATGCKVAAALAASPAQSLAAHDAEVRAQALREAAAWLREQHGDMTLEHYAREIEALADKEADRV